MNKIFLLLKGMVKSLYLMLMKCYYHPLANNGSASINEGVIKDCSLDIVEMIASTNELAKELVNKKIYIFKK